MTGEQASEAVSIAATTKRGVDWRRVLVYGLLPGLALILGVTAGFLKWQDASVRNADLASAESLQFARDSAVTLLSYKPETVERDLDAARSLTTGEFRDAYVKLIDEVVIPGAKEQQIATTATIPAAASVSANENHAVALLFVNQAVSVGNGAPTDSASSVRVSLDKVGDRWLVSGFDPV